MTPSPRPSRARPPALLVLHRIVIAMAAVSCLLFAFWLVAHRRERTVASTAAGLAVSLLAAGGLAAYLRWLFRRSAFRG